MLALIGKNHRNIFEAYSFIYFWGYFYFSAGTFAWVKTSKKYVLSRNQWDLSPA